ncbi:MAG TPA: hypothetical protein VG796_06935 [Verrucomicrobiales bacterium]|nr:hypothetical protein [Verrucomicrobiales bacterium]
MTPDEYAARILAESSEGTQWEWSCPLLPKGYRRGHDKLTFGDELRKLLPAESEITQDLRTDRLIVRRMNRIDEVPRWHREPPKEQQQKLF